MEPQSKSADGPIKVLLVDDHRSVLWGLEKLIDGEKPRMMVVGKATSATEAMALLESAKPDVVLLDLDLNGESGLKLMPGILARANPRVLILTGSRDAVLHDNAVLAGARGVVEKGEAAETLIKAIEKVHEGEIWLDRTATGRIFVELARRKDGKHHDPEQQKIGSLTRKERQIVAAIASDASAPGKQIAERLNISEHTLRNHLTSVYAKLSVGNRLELFAYANKHRILNEPGE
jgi:two-component system nitrate/nitrite response regulator NarL